MKLSDKKSTCSYLIIACTIILGLQCAFIAYCNLVLGPKNIDCDGAMLYVHAIEMARNHSYIIPDWKIITTLELDCSLLFAVPLFMLTGNIYVSFSVANLLMISILIWMLFMMFSGKSRLYPLLCANFILIPYGIGQLDYFNMMFFNGSQYIMKVLLPLQLTALLVLWENGKKRSRSYVVLGVIYSLFLLTSSMSSGVYILAAGIFPVFAGFLFYHLYHRKRFTAGFWAWGSISALTAGAGLIANAGLAAGAKGNSMTLCSVAEELGENISACLLGMFELFGGAAYENVPVMSFEGIKVLLHMGFAALLLLGGYLLARQVLQRKAQLLSCILLAVFLWNTFILCVCKTRYGSPTYEYRYHLVGMIPLLCGAVIVLLQWYEKETECFKRGIAAAVIVLLGALNLTSYKGVLSHESDVSNYQQICDYAAAEDLSTVYFLYDSTPSEICRLLDYENGMYLALDGEGNTVVYDYYSKYDGAPVAFESAALAVNHEIYDFGDKVEMFGHVYTRVAILGKFSIYV